MRIRSYFLFFFLFELISFLPSTLFYGLKKKQKWLLLFQTEVFFFLSFFLNDFFLSFLYLILKWNLKVMRHQRFDTVYQINWQWFQRPNENGNGRFLLFWYICKNFAHNSHFKLNTTWDYYMHSPSIQTIVLWLCKCKSKKRREQNKKNLANCLRWWGTLKRLLVHKPRQTQWIIGIRFVFKPNVLFIFFFISFFTKRKKRRLVRMKSF